MPSPKIHKLQEDPEIIKKLYYIENLSVAKIAKKYNVSRGCAYKFFKRNNIKCRTFSECRKVEGTFVGEKNPMYGRTGEKHPNFGKNHSEETKQKLREKRAVWLSTHSCPSGENHYTKYKKAKIFCKLEKMGISVEFMKTLYYDELKSMREIAKILNVNVENVVTFFKKFDIKCRTISEDHKNRKWPWLGGKGEKNGNWRGGINSINSAVRTSDQYSAWRIYCLKRDKFKCIKCGSIKDLQVDHIIPFIKIIKENKIENMDEALSCSLLWDTGNGRTLCLECHKQTDTYGAKVHAFIQI